MARKKNSEESPYSKKKVVSKWVRTGGGIGDDSMDVGSAFDADGCGVQGPVRAVGADPNEGVRLERQSGAE